MKLLFSSLLTLGLMMAMVLALIIPTLGGWDLSLSLIFTTVIFAFFWLVGPWINDHLYHWIYKVEWVDLAAFRKRSPASARMIEQMAEKYHFNLPKIGLIADNNPTAFTYGSGKWNPRLVVSEGIFVYLNETEREAVIGHETGHIANNDFIVMTMAAFLVSVMFQLSRIFLRSKSGGGKKGGGYLFIIGIVAYVFYLIGTYMLLFLSRTREYLADEFSARETGKPDELASALVKIAFGLIQAAETDKSSSLAEATRTLGIYDHKAAKSFGLASVVDMNAEKSNAVEGAIRYDLHSLWGRWAELHSSHPLTGKRIARLESEPGSKQWYGSAAIAKQSVDTSRLWTEFIRDGFITYISIIVRLIGLVSGILLPQIVILGIALFLL